MALKSHLCLLEQFALGHLSSIIGNCGSFARYGPVAQLGERHNGIVEVMGSSPFRSTLSWRKPAAINRSGTAEASFVSERRGLFLCEGI
jgi:hypothetical protein